MNVQEFLRQRDVPFQMMDHRPTYNAQSLAQAVHVSGEEVAKTVLLRAGEDYMLAVVPATHTIDLHGVEELVGVEDVDLATEAECGYRFNDCELGALPPFGSRYGMKTLVERSLAEHDEIVFESNNHHEAVRMRFSDFETLEQPMVGHFANHL
jgi:Ala-tRNA(Pro) deacylase